MKTLKKLSLALVALALAISATLLPVSTITAEAATVKMSKAKATLEVDAQLKLKVSGTKTSPKWSTNQKSIATIDKNGLVTAKAEGIATITAKVADKKYTCIVTVVDSNKKTTKDNGKKEKIYKLSETWTVDGAWSLTFDSVQITDERNRYHEEEPAQVIVLEYSYENFGYKGSFTNLTFSSLDMKVFDENQNPVKTYPAFSKYKEAKIGEKYEGAQFSYGLNDDSSKVTVVVTKRNPNTGKDVSATFELDIEK